VATQAQNKNMYVMQEEERKREGFEKEREKERKREGQESTAAEKEDEQGSKEK
jgi:hypothetical protein